jgi:hypothetical protein
MPFTAGELRSYLTLDDAQYNRAVDRAGKRFTGLGRTVNSTGAKVASGLAAIGITKWLLGSTDVVHQYEITLARLRTVVQATGGSWAPYSKAMTDVVDKQSQLSAYSGGELRGALADLTQVTGNASKGLDLLGLTTDLARGKSMDLATSAKLVGKVAMGNYAVLARYGIIIKQGTAPTEALAQLQARFAGQAKAYGDTSAGAQDKLRNALKKLQLTIGEGIVPSLVKLADSAVVVLNGFEKLPGPVKDVAVALAGIGVAGLILAPWAKALGGIVKWLIALPAKLTGSAAAQAVETAAVDTNTAAVAANTAAWGENAAAKGFSYSMGGAGTSAPLVRGIGVGAAPLGEATGVAAGGATTAGLGLAVAGGVAGGVAGYYIATPVEKAIAQAMSSPETRKAVQERVNAGMTYGGAGRAVTMVAPAGTSYSALMDSYGREKKSLQDIAQAVKDIKPDASNAGALGKYIDQLDHLAKTTKDPELAKKSKALAQALKDQSPAFNQAARDALAYSKALGTASASMADFAAEMMKAAMTGKGWTPDQAAKNASATALAASAEYQAGVQSGKIKWTAPANSGSGIFQPGQTGMRKVPKFGSGGDFFVRGATPIVVGDNPAGERVRVTPGGKIGGDGVVVNLTQHFGNVVGGKAGLREFSGMVQQDVMKGVKAAMAGTH